MSSKSRVQWIDRPRDLERVADRLAEARVIGVDTEQDSYFAYKTKVCVLQIGALGREWILDTLALTDLSCLRDVMVDRSIVKVLHAGENDVDLLRRQCDLEFEGVFDTMSAASILGYAKTGLAGLLDIHFDVTLEKKFQRSDWRQRPLSREQIEYAALDVRYLEDLMRVLADELVDKGRVEEAESDFERVAHVVHTPKEFSPDDYFRLSGARDLNAVGRSVLRELYVLREEIAEEEDRALFRVCGDAILVELARRRPKSRADLARLRGLPDRMKRTYAQAVLDAVARGVEHGPLSKPRPKPSEGPSVHRLEPAQKERFDRLRSWRARRAEKRGVEPGRVIPNALLLRVVVAEPTDVEGLEEAGLEAWRVREYGDEILTELGRG